MGAEREEEQEVRSNREGQEREEREMGERDNERGLCGEGRMERAGRRNLWVGREGRLVE